MRCHSCGGYLDVTFRHDRAYIVREDTCGQCKALHMYDHQPGRPVEDRPGRKLSAEPLPADQAVGMPRIT